MARPYHFNIFASDPRIAALLDLPRHRVEHPVGLVLGQGHDDEAHVYPQPDHALEVRALELARYAANSRPQHAAP